MRLQKDRSLSVFGSSRAITTVCTPHLLRSAKTTMHNERNTDNTFLTPPVAGALFLAALVASCLRGAFPPVDLRAVCLVRAILTDAEVRVRTRKIMYERICER